MIIADESMISNPTSDDEDEDGQGVDEGYRISNCNPVKESAVRRQEHESLSEDDREEDFN